VDTYRIKQVSPEKGTTLCDFEKVSLLKGKHKRGGNDKGRELETIN